MIDSRSIEDVEKLIRKYVELGKMLGVYSENIEDFEELTRKGIEQAKILGGTFIPYYPCAKKKQDVGPPRYPIYFGEEGVPIINMFPEKQIKEKK